MSPDCFSRSSDKMKLPKPYRPSSERETMLVHAEESETTVPESRVDIIAGGAHAVIPRVGPEAVSPGHHRF